MPKQSNDRKSPKMIDVLGEVVFRNRISRKVKFIYLSEMASNIEQQFWTWIKNQNLVMKCHFWIYVINLIRYTQCENKSKTFGGSFSLSSFCKY